MSIIFTPTQLVAIESLEDHPKNSNVVPEATLGKLERNIKRSGIYPPLIVRELPGGRLRIIDGHHRRIILRKLGYTEVAAQLVTCSDREELALLASLNTLHGVEDPRKRAALIAELSQTVAIEELALILPEDVPQIQDFLSLANTDFVALEESLSGGGDGEGDGPRAKTFMLFEDQREVVDNAIAAAMADGQLGRMKNAEGTAIEFICAEYLAGRPAQPIQD